MTFKEATRIFVSAAIVAVLLNMTACLSRAQKAPLRAADAAVQVACQGLAQALAERTNADAERIIAASCAVEAVTRTMRELLLSEQLNAAKAAGVLVPSITSGDLEPMPAEMQDAE